jgi:general stress protein CsbA
MIKAIKNFIYSLLSEDGKLSTKRFVGILTAVFLCGALIFSLYKKGEPASILVECLTVISVGALGISATQSIFNKKEKVDGSSEKTSDKETSS